MLAHTAGGKRFQCNEPSQPATPEVALAHPDPIALTNSEPSQPATQEVSLAHPGPSAFEPSKPAIPGVSRPLTAQSDPATWTYDEVVDYINSMPPDLAMYADRFRVHKIDGAALLLLSPDQLVNFLSIELGPAVKIFSKIASQLSSKSVRKSSPNPKSKLSSKSSTPTKGKNIVEFYSRIQAGEDSIKNKNIFSCKICNKYFSQSGMLKHKNAFRKFHLDVKQCVLCQILCQKKDDCGVCTYCTERESHTGFCYERLCPNHTPLVIFFFIQN